jgi:hypothetical protein
MSILERPASEPGPPDVAPAPSDRLRVITAGRVGNMDARLGTSGFDVVAAADTEEDLIVAVAADEPDAIVVEADLCKSLERVRDLAPDAVLIVMGDHTPAGALGRIESGVSGTVMARLLHALVAEGVGAAVVWGLVPALRPPVGAPAHVSGSLLAAKTELVWSYLANALHEHAGWVAALGTVAGTVVVTASAGLLLTSSAPRLHERAGRVAAEAPAVEGVVGPPGRRGVPVEKHSSLPFLDGRGSAGRSARGEHRSADHGRHDGARPDHRSPTDARTPPAERSAARPPGVAKGWDLPPQKKDDNGKRPGWTDNSVPDDLPPAKVRDQGKVKGEGHHGEGSSSRSRRSSMRIRDHRSPPGQGCEVEAGECGKNRPGPR